MVLSLCLDLSPLSGRRVAMPRRPGETVPEPPGGRAAERLREFIAQRFPGEVPVQEGAREEAADADLDTEQGEDQNGTAQGKRGAQGTQPKAGGRKGRRARGHAPEKRPEGD